MGQVAGSFATRVAIDKAKENGVATVTLRNTKHLGRCGAYPLMAAEEGLVGLAFVNALSRPATNQVASTCLGFMVAPPRFLPRREPASAHRARRLPR